MDCDSLIDFSSPLRKDVNMLDPLVPLPKGDVHGTNDNIDVIEVVGDNPFDNAIFQLCKYDDPFEVTEKKAFEVDTKENKLPKKQNLAENVACDDKQKDDVQPTNKNSKTTNENVCDTPPLKTKLKPNVANTNVSCVASEIGKYTSLKSMHEASCSPVSSIIQKKFSKLYLSAQLDKQILDESFKFVDSGLQDSSLLGSSTVEALNKSERCPSPMDIPTKPEEVKAFVANRIGKCIEKTLNQSRRSLNNSFRHRRSLSATSLHMGTVLYAENPLNYSSLKPSFEPPLLSAKYKNCSFSTQDLRSSMNVNIWGNQHDPLDAFTNNVANASNRCNLGFRRSTATSSMYSSCATGDIGFRKNTSSLTTYSPLNSSFPNRCNEMTADDSVFMAAKNLSYIFQRRAQLKDDESLEVDFNFINDDKCEIELVESDSSYSDSDIGAEKLNSSGKVDEKSISKIGNAHKVKDREKESLPIKKESPVPLCQEKIKNMELRPSGLRSKKFCNPLIVPPPTNNGQLVLKPKTKTERKVEKRGPMKAMIPVGNMMRSEGKKENSPPLKVDVGPKLKGATKSVCNSGSLRKSVSAGNLPKSKNALKASEVNSPAVCGRPVACSTPSVDGVVPLESPPVRLQVSQIHSGSPVDVGTHRRSKSTGGTVSKNVDTLASTPFRKASGHFRSKIGLGKDKEQSPDSLSPGQSPTFTSTPLKAIPKNASNMNRLKKFLPANRKLLQRENNSGLEKENLQPSMDKKVQQFHKSSRRVRD